MIKKVIVLSNGVSSGKTSRPELYNSFNEKGVKPYIGSIFDGEINDYYEKNNIGFIPIIASRNNTNPIVEIKSIINIRKKIKSEKIEAALIYGVKNHAAMAIGCHLGGAKRIICVVNGSGNLFKLDGVRGKLLRLISFPALRIAYRYCDSICFQNQDDLNLFFQKKLINKKTDTFVTGGSGVNLNNYPLQKLEKNNNVLFLARITPTKGIKEYIEAAYIVKEKYPNTMFDIVGPLDSAVESSIDDLLKKAICDKVVYYHGKTKDVVSFIKKCRVFVYPSYYPEGVPRCVIQAMSCGRPIITCNTPGCKETVINEKNGFLVEPKNAVEIAKKIIYMIENPKIVEEMAINSRIIAEEKFDVNKVNEIIIEKLID